MLKDEIPHFGHTELPVATCKGSKLNSFGASQIGVICIMEDWNLIFNRYKNVTNQCFDKYWSLWQKEMWQKNVTQINVTQNAKCDFG